MFGIGGSELVAILLIALIVLGPERLPAVARTLARLYREFTKVRKQAGTAVEDIRKELRIDDDLLDDAPKAREPEGQRSERPRLRLDQLAVAEQIEADLAADEQRLPGGEASGLVAGAELPYIDDPLPVPDTDDYLSGPAAPSDSEGRP